MRRFYRTRTFLPDRSPVVRSCQTAPATKVNSGTGAGRRKNELGQLGDGYRTAQFASREEHKYQQPVPVIAATSRVDYQLLGLVLTHLDETTHVFRHSGVDKVPNFAQVWQFVNECRVGINKIPFPPSREGLNRSLSVSEPLLKNSRPRKSSAYFSKSAKMSAKDGFSSLNPSMKFRNNYYTIVASTDQAGLSAYISRRGQGKTTKSRSMARCMAKSCDTGDHVQRWFRSVPNS